MKKLLSLLTALCVTAVPATSLVSCHIFGPNSNPDDAAVDLNKVNIAEPFFIHNSQLTNWSQLQNKLLNDIQTADSGTQEGNTWLAKLSFTSVNIVITDQHGHKYTSQDFDKLMALSQFHTQYTIIANQDISAHFKNSKEQDFAINQLVDISKVAFHATEKYFKKYSLSDTDDLTNFKAAIKKEYIEKDLIGTNAWLKKYVSDINNDITIEIFKTDGNTKITTGLMLKQETNFKVQFSVPNTSSLYLVGGSHYMSGALQLTTYDLNDLHSVLASATALNILTLTPDLKNQDWSTVLKDLIIKYLANLIPGFSATDLKSALNIDVSGVADLFNPDTKLLTGVKITPADSDSPFENSKPIDNQFSFNVQRNDQLSYSNQMGQTAITYNDYLIAEGQGDQTKMYVSPALYSDLYDKTATKKLFSYGDKNLLNILKYSNDIDHQPADATKLNFFAQAAILENPAVGDPKTADPNDILGLGEQKTLELNLLGHNSNELAVYDGHADYKYEALIVMGVGKNGQMTIDFDLNKPNEIFIPFLINSYEFNISVDGDQKITKITIDETSKDTYLIDKNIQTILSADK